jgi:hypothetical protein
MLYRGGADIAEDARRFLNSHPPCFLRAFCASAVNMRADGTSPKMNRPNR